MSGRLYILLALLCCTSVAAADPVSEFSQPDLQGKQQTLAQYHGKWIVINYWATDCPPCVHEIPELVNFYDHHKDRDAVVLGVNYEDIKLAWLKDFISSVHMDYPVLRSSPDRQTPFGAIEMLPTTIIISPDGKLMGLQRGAVTAKLLDDYLEKHGVAAHGSKPGAVRHGDKPG